eukprot:38523_1
MLNNMNFIDVLVNNIKKFEFDDFQNILEIIGCLINQSFNCDTNAIELFECIKTFIAVSKDWVIDINSADKYRKWRNNKCKILKKIINCCYSKYNILAIECCVTFLKQLDCCVRQWIENGIITAFKDFMAQMDIDALDDRYKQKYSDLLHDIAEILDRCNSWLDRHQLNEKKKHDQNK